MICIFTSLFGSYLGQCALLRVTYLHGRPDCDVLWHAGCNVEAE